MSNLAFSSSQKETIAAQATAPGRGGVGIIRVSGPEVKNVAQAAAETVFTTHSIKND